MRADSIRRKGLKHHVNQYAMKHDIPFRYGHLVKWLEDGVYGQPVSDEWIRRQFPPLTRNTFDKWKMIYQEDKQRDAASR